VPWLQPATNWPKSSCSTNRPRVFVRVQPQDPFGLRSLSRVVYSSVRSCRRTGGPTGLKRIPPRRRRRASPTSSLPSTGTGIGDHLRGNNIKNKLKIFFFKLQLISSNDYMEIRYHTVVLKYNIVFSRRTGIWYQQLFCLITLSEFYFTQ